MVQCEMCGAETSSPKTIKVEGAKLDVCSNCTDFGTEVKQPSSSSTSTKYSTGSSSSGGRAVRVRVRVRPRARRRVPAPVALPGPICSTTWTNSSPTTTTAYATPARGLSQSDLANELNEKASLIRKIERGDTLPSDRVQSKLERFLEIDLSAEGGSGEDSEWSGAPRPAVTRSETSSSERTDRHAPFARRISVDNSQAISSTGIGYSVCSSSST